MKFMCLVYFDETSFAGMSLADMQKLTDATIEEDHELRRRGQLILGQPLQEPKTAVNIRVRKGRVRRTDGPFAETKEWLGGFFADRGRRTWRRPWGSRSPARSPRSAVSRSGRRSSRRTARPGPSGRRRCQL